jgi:hypothetical protein
MQYAVIPEEAVMDSDQVGGAAFRVYAYLCLRRNKTTGICFPKLKTIARDLKMNRGHVSQLKKVLLDHGWITECGEGSFRPIKGFDEVRLSNQKFSYSNQDDGAESLDKLTPSLDNLTPSLDNLTKSLDNLTNNNNIDINRQINRPVNRERGANKSRTPATKGTRLPSDFSISEEMREWAMTKHPLTDIDAETEAFIDYWRGVAGAKGLKLDWSGTWRNWIRRSKQFNRTATVKKTFSETMEDYARLDAKWAAEEAALRSDNNEKQIGDGLPRADR